MGADQDDHDRVPLHKLVLAGAHGQSDEDQPARQAAFQQQHAISILRAFIRSIWRIDVQIYAIDDHRRGRFCNPVPIIPPFADELTLINHTICETTSYQSQYRIPILRAEVITRSRPAHTLHPVNAVQSLDDANAAPPRPTSPEALSISATTASGVIVNAFL